MCSFHDKYSSFTQDPFVYAMQPRPISLRPSLLEYIPPSRIALIAFSFIVGWMIAGPCVKTPPARPPAIAVPEPPCRDSASYIRELLDVVTEQKKFKSTFKPVANLSGACVHRLHSGPSVAESLFPHDAPRLPPSHIATVTRSCINATACTRVYDCPCARVAINAYTLDGHAPDVPVEFECEQSRDSKQRPCRHTPASPRHATLLAVSLLPSDTTIRCVTDGSETSPGSRCAGLSASGTLWDVHVTQSGPKKRKAKRNRDDDHE